MGKFKVVSEYTPSGDQPQAIDTLASGIENGLRDQVLLGVTGSAGPQQDPGGPAVRGVPGLLPGKRRGILRVLL